MHETTEPFDGYPYLVTRIGRSALRHMAVLPADWPRGRLLELARRQAEANRLETCLCLGPTDAVSFTPDGETGQAVIAPTGIPVAERLALVEPVPPTEKVATRRLAPSAVQGGGGPARAAPARRGGGGGAPPP